MCRAPNSCQIATLEVQHCEIESFLLIERLREFLVRRLRGIDAARFDAQPLKLQAQYSSIRRIVIDDKRSATFERS